MLHHRYSRWDGSQEVFPIREDELMDHLSDHLLNHGDLSTALHSLIQRGVQGRDGQRLVGLQELLQRLRQLRQEVLQRYDLDSLVQDIQRRLDSVVQQELQGMARRLEEARQRAGEQGLARETEEGLLSLLDRMVERNRQVLQALPTDVAGAIRSLQEYEFMDAEAKAHFDELVDSLQGRVLDAHLRDLTRRLQGLTPQDLERARQMLHDLNRLLRDTDHGDWATFQRFVQQHGEMFGPNPPASLEELVERLQRQVAQMESLLRSMSQEQRQQLRDILDSVFRNQELRRELAELALALERMHGPGDLGQDYDFVGQEPVTLDKAMDLVRRLQEMGELEKQLTHTQHGGGLSSVDSRSVRDLLGVEAYQHLEQLKEMVQRLEEAGYIQPIGARHELTPKGMRRIGQKALGEIFVLIKKDRAGSHAVRRHGLGGERVEETKPYQFGDAFEPHLPRTLMNAVQRQGAGCPVSLEPGDFEVYRTEQTSQSSTVLMIDQSLSMAMRGNFLAAKKVALALDSLIRTQFPRDSLHIVGFSTYAREVEAEQLAYLRWDEFDPYTNIQHGLALSQKLLARVSGGTKQIIMVSDGEPTAHMETGELFLQYPPSPRTIRQTLLEVQKCTRRGIVISTFMLGRSPYLNGFMDQMTRLNRGRVFYTSPDRLGQYILVDYVTSRRRVIG
ncbi:MAG: VWA domain-containing protein [Chloroflexi bacterium]|nr:VWA domain-containing protein [Chloroflexota bacterium]